MLVGRLPPRSGHLRRQCAADTPPSVSTGTAHNGATRPKIGIWRRRIAAITESISKRQHESSKPDNIRPLVGCSLRSLVSRSRRFGRSIEVSLSSGLRDIGVQALSTVSVGFARFGGGCFQLEPDPLSRPHRTTRTHCGARTSVPFLMYPKKAASRRFMLGISCWVRGHWATASVGPIRVTEHD